MERTLTLDDGATTILESWGERGPAVICIHGITSSRKSWTRTADALRDSYRVFAYDQRGHGDSARVAGPMTLQRSLLDLRVVARAVGEPAAIIGHSWGGAIALLGGREPFTSKVVAIDPMLRVEAGTWRREYLDDTERDLALEPGELERELRRRLSGWDESDIAGKLHAVRHMTADAVARLGSENEVDRGGWDLRPIVAAYPKPLLILAAAPSDSVLSADDIEDIRTHGGPNVTLETFADQGHNLHRTAFDRYIAATRAFLAN
ncbi:MAG TPA: alpha/beta hydrolase [Candidatus Eremiobacteraceae bacterium]|nr:alpha/beta hydrolase [Candidatus Eremiobacteraceae bacterium]